MSTFHQPVLLQSACTWLNIQPKCRYVDATLGGGGHAAEILRRGGLVLGLDQDQEALDYVSTLSSFQLALSSKKLILIRANFIHLEEVVTHQKWQPVSGILFDLGASWHQLVTPGRGFSFQIAGPLDMRMDTGLPNTAADLVNNLSAKQLASLLRSYGEIPAALSLAKRIIDHKPYTTTAELATVTGTWSRQAFQALRMAVNDELTAITTVLPQALKVLRPAGRMVVITFHSLEDRLVKNLFQNWSKTGLGQTLTPRPVTPDPEELAANPKSHSAKLRVFEKN
ncbi:16S rRNA (cytosine(1402)-N(4))-methyltransferase [Candidatus Amesbacteria bacterium RIFCSPHIGHO2_01_FULL_48_75]|uniref:Ribosomal RNA small subunit methyltransferase H n=1 Tax=Candidatus Amesbacteria bacterium GW2011_GWC1_48_10 TaxID=1618365 RepID=A0A0G1ULH9_9BACT|nr:MAG: S-adenosyl-methyltransferase MraW, S-adenosyl-methyltransferase [Candidatus Amesbacteria bacterium GW2011_GWC1_48_10]OGC99451.1 MAG: 16S rRNA (cytosine(1402)-N(4))-methyltransferase [Candidatus Amesbacteria bacterium RIFCSPHIGHO2_01_FULL_48_75]